MEFSQTALIDLSILFSRDHPSLVIQNIVPKEGFSLFSLFDFTLLKRGQTYLRYLFSTPLINLD